MIMWKDLNITDKAALIKIGVNNGIYDLNTIRNSYNQLSNDTGILYKDGGLLDKITSKIKSWFTTEEETPKPRDFRTDRIRHNTSPTARVSEALENTMYKYYPKTRSTTDIPFIPEKAIMVNGYLTSTNALDSLAKYAGIHNRTLQVSEKPIKRNSTTRKLTKEESIGLSTHETRNGAMGYMSEKNILDAAKKRNLNKEQTKEYLRAFANANVFTAFGGAPAVAMVNNYHYNTTSRTVHPLLDAFRYYAQGDYNRGDKTHTKKVQKAGKDAFISPEVMKWWNETGRDYFTGKRK